MNLVNVTEPIPLQTNDQGVVRVAATRITLDEIVADFDQALTTEEIAYQDDQ